MQGSPDHLAKRLQKIGLSLKKTVLFHYLLTILLAVLGLTVMLSSFKTALAILSISFGGLLILALVLLKVKMEK